MIAGTFYPTDKYLKQSIQVFKAYSGKYSHNHTKTAFILMAIEDHLWGKADVVPHLKGPSTIEHLMPQNLTDEWKVEIGIHWEQIHKDYLHTLGNLNLVTQSRNSQLSNLSFSEKKRILLAQGLRLNKYFSDNIPCWNDRTILTRADWLTKYILEIWPSLM